MNIFNRSILKFLSLKPNLQVGTQVIGLTTWKLGALAMLLNKQHSKIFYQDHSPNKSAVIIKSFPTFFAYKEYYVVMVNIIIKSS